MGSLRWDHRGLDAPRRRSCRAPVVVDSGGFGYFVRVGVALAFSDRAQSPRNVRSSAVVLVGRPADGVPDVNRTYGQ